MASYIRRFTDDPGLDILLDIESVNILDLDPPEAAISSVGNGTAILVAEMENGDFDTPTELFGASDLLGTFGGFGYVYDGVKACNPCARSRKADSAVVPEYWNGNGAIALNGKKFKRLIVVRPDTSVGEVSFWRLAALTGTFRPTYDLEPGQVLSVKTNLVASTPVTFTAAEAVLTGVGGGFALAAGEYVVLGYDTADDFQVTFQTGDTSVALVVARINQYAGFTFASVSAGQVKLTSRQRGTAAEVRVMGESMGALAKIGLSLSATKGSETSTAVFPVALQPGDTFLGKVDQQALADTLTITATIASLTGAGATYAAVTAGHTMSIEINGVPGTQVVSFAGTENTQALFLATINSVLVGGAAVNDGGQIKIKTDQKGSGAGGSVVACSHADVENSTGFTGAFPMALVNAGPNNVADVLRVTAAEFAGQLTSTFTDGTAGSLGVAVGTTQVRWESNTGGVTPKGVQFTGGTGVAKIAGFDLLEHNGLASTAGATAGTGNVGNIDTVTVAEVNTLVHAAVGALYVTTDADDAITLYNSTTTGIATVQVVGATTTATDFGFPTDVDGVQATADADVTIPAGTRVRNAGSDEWVTMQDLPALMTEYGPWTVKVRPATDDGTAASDSAGDINVLPYPVSGGMYAVSNQQPMGDALTELELDDAYYNALQSTLDLNSIAKEGNLIWAARQSNNCRRFVRQNAIDASAIGCRGRVAAIRPPLGTTRAKAKAGAEPSVVVYRHENVFYTYPGVQMYVPAIALRGLAGGAGFTADGVINAGADGFLIAVCSQLPSEENPGQLTSYMDAVIGLESGTEFAGWTIDDYKAFKKAGIAAVRMDDGVPIFQSGVTSVDPAVYPAKTRISRRRFSYEIQDTLALRAKKYGKKLSRKARRNQFIMDCREYMNSLMSPEDANRQRLDSFEIDAKSRNTPNVLSAGALYVIVRAKTFPSLDAINIQSEIGENVVITAQ